MREPRPTTNVEGQETQAPGHVWGAPRAAPLEHCKCIRMSQKRGLIGTKIRQNNWYCFGFLVFKYNYKGSRGFKLFQNGRFWLPDIFQYFWIISGKTKNVTKYRPPDPVLITKILQKYITEIMGTSLKISFSYLRIWNSEKVERSVYLTCRLFFLFFFICCSISEFPCSVFCFWVLETWNVDFVKTLQFCLFWNVINFKCWKVEKSKTGTRRWWRSP